MKTSIVIILAMALATVNADQDNEIGTDLMRHTVKLVVGAEVGTGFFIGMTNRVGSSPVTLVSAAHVLTNGAASNITVIFHPELNGIPIRTPMQVTIRSNGTPLWIAHATADVAAVNVPLPLPLAQGLVPEDAIADEDFFRNYKIHAGDEVRIIGYPRGFEALGGFPVLRSGRISTYPLIPTSVVRHYLVDFVIFPGMSGGPVFMSERRYMITGAMDSVTINRVVGLVIEDISFAEALTLSATNIVTVARSYGLGVIVPGPFIRQTIQLLREKTQATPRKP